MHLGLHFGFHVAYWLSNRVDALDYAIHDPIICVIQSFR